MARDAEKGSAGPWGWRSGVMGPMESPVGPAFFDRTTEVVARDLLGCRIRSVVDGKATEGVIVETEAYLGPHDPASHAAERIGRTQRNDPMYGRPGTAYVYRIYGVHWCLNTVTEREGFPAAVLVRALDPIMGKGYMRERRAGRSPLCSGPGRLAQALGLDGRFNGHDLREEPLTVLGGWRMEDRDIGTSGRVGVSRAADWPQRYFVRGHPAVSKHRS